MSNYRLRRLKTQITQIMGLAFILCFLFLTPAYSALSVGVTGGDWAIGTVGAGAVKLSADTEDSWTATNDGDGYEDISIKVDGTTWHPGSSAGEETFILKYDTTGTQDWSDPITTGGISLSTCLAASGTQDFDLQFTAPTSSSVANVQQALTVTLTAATKAGWCSCGDTLTYQSKTYNTVQLGDQCWFRENLDYNINNCTSITWSSSDVGACSYYDGGPFTDEGLLYQWSAAMNDAASCNGTGAPPNDACSSPVQGICPAGWHIPSHYEYTTLEREVCTSGTCATDFPYDTSTTGWRGTDEGTTLKTVDSTHFSGLLAGSRSTGGSFVNRGAYASFWSSLESGSSAWTRGLGSGYSTVSRTTNTEANGFSVRCLKD